MTESANYAPESRDIPKESEAPQSAQIDSTQYQTGENLRANNSADNTKDLGFGNTSIDGATSKDTKYSPASAMSGQDKRDKPTSAGRAAGGEEDAAKSGEQAPKAERQKPNAEKTESQQRTRSSGERPEAGGLYQARTEKLEGGGSRTSTSDDRSNTSVVRDRDGKISSITNNTGTSDEVTTNYSPDGKPRSQVNRDGTAVHYDENSKVTSDTRDNSSDRPTPQALQTTRNPDGTTTYSAPNSDGTHQDFTFRDDGSLARTSQKTSDGTTRENDFYQNGSIKEQRLSNPGRFNAANEIKNTWDQNGVQRSTETKNHQGWAREEYDGDGSITKESHGSHDGRYKLETNYRGPNGDITTDTVKGDRLTNKVEKRDNSSITTETNRKTQEVRYTEFKRGEGTTHIYMTPQSYQRRAYDTNGKERMDKRVDYNSKR